MTLQTLVSIAIRLDGQVIQYEPGAVFTATAEQAQRLLERAPGKLQVLTSPPDEPLQPGWLICYRDRAERLAGGCDDRAHGTVQRCEWDGTAWTVCLTDGQHLSLRAIRGVGQTNVVGEVIKTWTVKEHGYNGERGG